MEDFCVGGGEWWRGGAGVRGGGVVRGNLIGSSEKSFAELNENTIISADLIHYTVHHVAGQPLTLLGSVFVGQRSVIRD